MWDEFGRYIYGLFFACVVTPLIALVRKFFKDKKALEEKVECLAHKFDKMSDKIDSETEQRKSFETKLDKLDQKNDKIFDVISRIEVATAINTTKLDK